MRNVKRLGYIQKRIIEYLKRHENGAYIGPLTIAPEFVGFTYDEVLPSLERLERRKIIKQLGLKYFIVENG